MSINKLALSLVNGALEIQPALANINFDFSLYKVDAPKEFEGVGAAMTSFRRNEAENGCTHRTARKLGALFEKLLPNTPQLLKAYGQRASEISKASSIDAEARAAYGVFASWVGPDATSLWAAATSGSSAIAVHLLACMLARIWEGPEATSIWVEITESRKKEIRDDFEQNNIGDMATLSAAQQDLARSQISEWDASARAWLRVADAKKCRQQKQLMLILENVQSSVNNKTETYSSVISAWKNALLQMEALISGISQEAQGGDIILGLSAWHLFPDLMVVGPRPATVQQRDPIFANGGILTVGLVNLNTEDRGIHWSLPLAHLRHYGVPVVSLSSIDSNERSRISTSELLLATFGCVLQGWGEAGNNTLQSVTWLNNVFKLLEKSRSAGGSSASILLEGKATLSWFSLLLTAARQYLECQGNERKTANKLIRLGRKHGKRFLDRPSEPLFGLLGVSSTNYSGSQSHSSTAQPKLRAVDIVAEPFPPPSMLVSRVGLRGSYVNLITTDDDKIHLLRKVAQDIAKDMDLDSTQIFIRYKRRYPNWSKHVYEYTTALPLHPSTLKRKFNKNTPAAEGHTRWLYSGISLRRVTDPRYYDRLRANFPDISDLQRIPEDFEEFHQYIKRPQRPKTDRYTFTPEEQQTIYLEFENRKRFYATLGENTIERESMAIEDFDPLRMGVFWDKMSCMEGNQEQKQTPWFRLLYGDENSAGLFVIEGRGGMLDLIRSHSTEATDFSSLFEAGKIDATAISNRLLQIFYNANAEVDPHLKALKAVSTAAAMYGKFPNTTVDVRVLQQPLWNAGWVQNCRDAPPEKHMDGIPNSLQPYHLDGATAFACIAMFESGTYNINPSLLGSVIALSSSDSIYIGGALLHDPKELANSGDIRRVLGNIGRSGMAFLVPPVDPMIREVKMSDWSCIDRDDFDGEMRDCFESTSLHLSFTGATTPVNLGFSGGQDVDAYMLETLISVRDCGDWVADLDVFNMINSVKFRIMGDCQGDCQDHNRNSVVTVQSFTAIDNWYGLIDAPETPFSIVRAHQNWQARLAATTISIALGYETVVLSDEPCWCCFNTKANEMSWGRFQNVILIG